MKAITIKQPWASLIVVGIKDVENRTWKTNFRGRVLIHASAKADKEHDGCVCNQHKGWICRTTFEDSKEVRYHSGWSKHGMCEMHTPIKSK